MKYYETVQGTRTWTGLQYSSGGPDDHPNLPDMSLTLGDTCDQQQGKRLMISLSPDQYSYKVTLATGRAMGGGRAPAGRRGRPTGRIDFLDLIYAAFAYERNSDDSSPKAT